MCLYDMALVSPFTKTSLKHQNLKNSSGLWSLLHPILLLAQGVLQGFHKPRHALHLSSRHLAFSIVILGLCAPISWKSSETVFLLSFRRCLELCSEWCNRVYSLWSSALGQFGWSTALWLSSHRSRTLPFHNIRTAIGRSNRAEIALNNLN